MSIPPNLKIRFRSTSKTDFEIISQPEASIPLTIKDKTVRGSPYAWNHPEINIPPKMRHKQYKHLACQTPPIRNNTYPYSAQPSTKSTSQVTPNLGERCEDPLQIKTITSKSMPAQPSEQHETKSEESQGTNIFPSQPSTTLYSTTLHNTQLPNSGLCKKLPQQLNTPHQEPNTPNNIQGTILQHPLTNNTNCLIKLVSYFEDRLKKSDTDISLKNKQILDYQIRFTEQQNRIIYLRKEMEKLLTINHETTRDLHAERRQRKKDEEYFQEFWYKHSKHTKK